MFCVNCGNSLLDGVNFCAQCGAKIVDNDLGPNNRILEPDSKAYINTFTRMDQNKPQPKSFLLWSIVLTFFGFPPFGIVSIVYASKVNRLYSDGNYEASLIMSENARIWINASWITMVLLWIGIILITHLSN